MNYSLSYTNWYNPTQDVDQCPCGLLHHASLLCFLCPMPLPKPVIDHLEDLLSHIEGIAVTISNAEVVYGGSINETYRLQTTTGPYFLKINEADQFPSLFVSEVQGLALLREAGELAVPDVIAQGEVNDTTFLLMQYIASEEADGNFQSRFGRALACMHRHSNASFGLDHGNYIGILPQQNTPHKDWIEFLVQNRFGPLVKMARERGKIGSGDVLRFERLYGKLSNLVPAEMPALLHGDLWKNNYIASENGRAVLIDPAVYYGHREMDVAMTKLFGGFDRDFYSAYNAEEPLELGWEERVDLCNLYPLLVHLNLFGGSYAERVHAVLRKYV